MNNLDMKLYEVAAELRDLCEGEEWDADALNSLVMAFETKANGIVAIAERMDTFAAYCKAEEERIYVKRKAVENRISHMKSYLQNCMEQAGMMELPLGTKKIVLQKNPPKVVVDDESQIPAEFFTVTVTKTLDKKAVADAIKRLNDEESFTGAHLERSLSLRIK